MSNQWVNFAAIKESVDIDQVLEHYRVRLKRVRKDYLRGLCPLPTHGSEQSRESFGVDTSRNVWACHSAIQLPVARRATAKWVGIFWTWWRVWRSARSARRRCG